MTQSKFIHIVFVLCITVVYTMPALCAQELVIGREMTVVRSKPGFLATAVGKLKYGDSCQIISKNENWVQVRSGKIKGWIHKTTAWPKKTVMSYIGKPKKNDDTSYKRDVVAAAGKGLKDSGGEIGVKNDKNTKAVIQMEKYGVAIKEIQKFSKDGFLDSTVFNAADKSR